MPRLKRKFDNLLKSANLRCSGLFSRENFGVNLGGVCKFYCMIPCLAVGCFEPTQGTKKHTKPDEYSVDRMNNEFKTEYHGLTPPFFVFIRSIARSMPIYLEEIRQIFFSTLPNWHAYSNLMKPQVNLAMRLPANLDSDSNTRLANSNR